MAGGRGRLKKKAGGEEGEGDGRGLKGKKKPPVEREWEGNSEKG